MYQRQLMNCLAYVIVAKFQSQPKNNYEKGVVFYP